ncbi:unnamed protein product [Gulo gulo]|uniref:Uncharacterized protein n=1 Tax=Gulo gulo TaxID=48420 RepID=A0A9X9LQ49_GULGU|nr:unnamed protein product [Gulo gulo]
MESVLFGGVAGFMEQEQAGEEKAEEALAGVPEERTVFTQGRWDVSSLHSLRTKQKHN